MSGPAIDPKAAAEIQRGATKPGYQSIVDLANKLANGYQQAVPLPGQAVEHVDEGDLRSARDNAATPSDPAQAMHMQQMKAKADAASQQYMQENGVDENGMPTR